MLMLNFLRWLWRAFFAFLGRLFLLLGAGPACPVQLSNQRNLTEIE